MRLAAIPAAPSLVQSDRQGPSRAYKVSVLGGVVLALAVVAVLQLWSAERQLRHGSQALLSTAHALTSPVTLRDPAVRATVRDHLAQAQDDFGQARHNLVLWGPFLDRLGWLPRVGLELAAAPRAADTAYETTSAAAHLMDGLAPIWLAITRHRASQPLLARLGPALEAGHANFEVAQADADQASRALALVPTHTGNATLDRATARLRRDLPLVRQATVWLSLAPSLLGVGRPSHVLFVWENPAELRATGGFLGAADFITLRDGGLSSHFTGRNPSSHQIYSVVVPLPEAMYTPEQYWIFADSNWSPDFPLSARLERWFYGEDTGLWTDTVVDFVDTGIPGILRATGPVYLPEYRRWIDAGNVESLAQQYINGKYKGPLRQGGPPGTVRKQFFSAVMRALLRRVQSLPLPQWPALALALRDEVAQGNLLLYDRRPDQESAIRTFGADGSMLPTSGDYLYIVDDNRSYNKLNPYVHERATYDVRIRPDLGLAVTLTIHYHVAPSPANLEGGGPYWGQWGNVHDYQDFLRVYAPPGAVLQYAHGLDVWAPQPAYGRTQFAGRFLVREEHDATVTLRYTLPATVFQAEQFQRYHLTVQHQPGGDLSSLQVRVLAPPGVTVQPPGGRAVPHLQALLSLQTHAYLDLALHGPVHPRTVALPPFRAPVDPYLPVDFFADPKHHL